jgi:hypothetical protein
LKWGSEALPTSWETMGKAECAKWRIDGAIGR